MGIFKYVHYIYVVLALLFAYDAYIGFSTNEGSPWLSVAFAVAALFMFFFRRKFSKKFEDRYKKP